jgi:hypothetical protein
MHAFLRNMISGEDMTIDDLLVLLPIFWSPKAWGNVCYNISYQHRNILHVDHPKRDHHMIYEQKCVDSECSLASGLASLLNIHVYSSSEVEGSTVQVGYAIERSPSGTEMLGSYKCPPTT